MNTTITKSVYIPKTTNRTRKIIYAKIERQINPNLPCKFCHFWINLKFWAPKTAPFGRPWRPNVIWRDMKFYAHQFFSSLRIYYVDMVTSEGGGGVCNLHILNCDRPRSLNEIWAKLNFLSKFFVEKFLKSQILELNENFDERIVFAYVSEYCVSFETKNPIWPTLNVRRGGEIYMSLTRNNPLSLPKACYIV